MSGPKATPSATLNARGSWRAKARAKKGEPEIEPLHYVPECPEWIEGYAREHWDRYALRLSSTGILTALDLDTYAALCLQYGRWRDAEDKLKEVESRIQITESGYEQSAGWTTEANKRFSQYREMCTHFGMTPAARAKVRAEAPKEGQRLDKGRFFNKGAK